MIRGVCAAKRPPSWQDLRAVYSQKAICRAFRIHGARILPKSAHFGCMAAICCQEGALFPSEAPFGIHEAQNLPRIAARERTAAESCHGKALGNAPRENIATASQAKSASGRNLAIARRPGTHFTGILPSMSARNATAPCTSTSCVAAPSMLAPNAPPMPYVPVAHAPAPPATAPRCHAPYAALLPPLKK